MRDQLVSMRVNGGFPYLTVNDGDYMKNNELYIKHWYEGIELDLKYLEKVLPYLFQLWGEACTSSLYLRIRKSCFRMTEKVFTAGTFKKRMRRSASSFYFPVFKILKMIFAWSVLLISPRNFSFLDRTRIPALLRPYDRYSSIRC